MTTREQQQQQQVYRPDPQLVQLQMQFAHALQEAQRKAATAVNIRATEAMKDHLLPLIEMSVALSLGGQQDLANYMRVVASASEAEVLIGLDPDTVEDFTVELQNVEAALKAALRFATEHVNGKCDLLAANGSDTNLLGQLQKALESIDDLKEAVNDVALDVDSGDEEEAEEADEEEDEEGSDEPLKIED